MTNEQIYNEILSEIPEGMRDNFPQFSSLNSDTIRNIKTDLFIDTLIRKIGKMLYLEQKFDNPYEILYREDRMPYGYSVEELFMESPVVIDLVENFETSSDEIDDLFNTELPKVQDFVSTAQLIKKCKVSVSEKRLRTAFYSEGGLYRLLTTLMREIRTALDKEKYREIEVTLSNFAEGEDYNGTKLVLKQGIKCIKKTELVKDIIKTIESFRITSNEFNPSKVETQSTLDDIIVFVTPDTYSEIMRDYTILNTYKYNIRCVKSLPKCYNNGSGTADVTTRAMILDKNVLPVLVNYDGVETFVDPNKLETQYFYYECFNLPVNTFSNFALIVD